MNLKLDALFVATQAPGRSAYNPVERRMAPLSRFLAGIILPFETFESHLNSQGLTIDSDREKSNFKKQGKHFQTFGMKQLLTVFQYLPNGEEESSWRSQRARRQLAEAGVAFGVPGEAQ